MAIFSKNQKNEKLNHELNVILAQSTNLKSIQDKLDWLVILLEWLRHESLFSLQFGSDNSNLAYTRLRFLLMVLDRQPEWKESVRNVLHGIVQSLNGFVFYTQTGMSLESGFLTEFSERLVEKALPNAALSEDVFSLLQALFPSEQDAFWLESIDDKVMGQIKELFPKDAKLFSADIEDSIVYLVIHSRAIGLSADILKRVDHSNFRESPFYKLLEISEKFIHSYRSKSSDFELCRSQLAACVHDCLIEIDSVHKHLDQRGIRIQTVYSLDCLRSNLFRLLKLSECLVLGDVQTKSVSSLLTVLIQDNLAQKSLKSFLRKNISMISRKIIERTAETGEHYITRNAKDYGKMFAAALGGGAVTAITVYMKNLIVSLHAAGFIQGFLASLNYSISFVFIHLAGFTLGTKQPAMTGPALAQKFKDMQESQHGVDDVVEEVAHLTRSQFASVFGNVCAVVPMAVIIDLCWYYISGNHLMSAEKAMYTVNTTDILGPALFYAAFTGVLLWFSSLSAGMADNWFALRSMKKRIAYNSYFQKSFGKVGAFRFASFLQNNISGLTGNIFLGFLLGLLPEILHFAGLAIEVRHVTLSSGGLAAAVSSLGIDFLSVQLFWRAAFGLLMIGLLNVGVSFAISFWLATRAIELTGMQKKLIYKNLILNFLKRPWFFFLP